MNQPSSANRNSSGLAIWIGSGLAALLIYAWFLSNKPAHSPTPGTKKPAAAVNQPATAKRPVNPAPSALPVTDTETVPPAESTVATTPAEPVPRGPLEDNWGIHVEGVSAVEGPALLIQYRVVAPQKALLIADLTKPAYLEELGTDRIIPFTPPEGGPASAHSKARSRALMMWQSGSFPPPPSRLIVGQIYSILIPNPNGAVKSGSTVSVVIGDHQSDGIQVEL